MLKSDLLKENIALVAGISLPVLLVSIFWIATAIPKMTVPDPRYDLIYTADYYDYSAPAHGTVNLEVRDGHLRATYHSVEHQNYHSSPRLYYFDVSSGSTHELTVDVPGDLQDGQELNIPEATGLKLSKKSIAPDGYSFDGNYSSRSGFFFFDGGYRYRGLIRKEGRAIKIPTHGHQYQGNLRFLGWVMENSQP
jgi:hypothetical protein